MSILDYAKSLVTVIKKNSILEDARITEQELKQKALPAYKDAVGQFRGKGAIKSPEILEMGNVFSRTVGGSPKDMVETIEERLKKVADLLVLSRSIVEKNFEETTVADGMTILKLNIVKVVESASFLSRYALRFLNHVYIVETGHMTEEEGYVKNHTTPAQRQWIEENFLPFCQLLSRLGISEKEAEKLVESMPDTVLGLDPEAATAMLGEKAVNPMGVMGFSPSTSNPIYHLRLFVAEYQANRYKEAVEMKTVLELRLLNLKRKQEGKFDARVEKEIEYTQSRVDSLAEKIREVEESVQ